MRSFDQSNGRERVTQFLLKPTESSTEEVNKIIIRKKKVKETAIGQDKVYLYLPWLLGMHDIYRFFRSIKLKKQNI
jgi:hypothetical protein